MKVIIVTTSFANNYGALLQAYSLRNYIENKFNIDTKVLDYWPEKSEEVWDVFYPIDNFRTLVRNIFVFFSIIYRRQMRNRKVRMFEFRKNYLNLTYHQYKNIDDILKDKDYLSDSIFICGSDQIWNTSSYWKDPVYFLDFTDCLNNSKAIAYAPSITDKWKKTDYIEIKEYLKKISKISVREQSDVEQVKLLLPSANVVQVIDPVFLHTAEEWADFSKNGKRIEGPYILCYFLGASKSAVSLVNKVKKLTGYKVVYLNINYSNPLNADINLIDASPVDFVSLIRNATIVINNSFHCSAFSVIFQKDYLVVPKNHANSRMVSLQESAGISDRLMTDDKINNLTVNDLHVDYLQSKTKLQQLIDYSKSYLKEALAYE